MFNNRNRCAYSSKNLEIWSYRKQTYFLLWKRLYEKEFEFCTSLKEHTKNIIDFEKKKIVRLTKEESKSHQDSKVCYICGKESYKSLLMIKIIEKL